MGGWGGGTNTPQRIPQVSRLREVFGSAILRNRSRRVEGMYKLRRSCPFSRYAELVLMEWGYSQLRIGGSFLVLWVEEMVPVLVAAR
jgi:hypothetical protein